MGKKVIVKTKVRVKKVRLKRRRFYYVNPIVRIWLTFKGKRDGKNISNHARVSPFVEFEKSKINKYKSKILYTLEKKTMLLLARYDKALAMLEQQSFIVKDIMERLNGSCYPEEIVIVKNQGLPSNIESMLDVKRDSEKSLDETAIRLRRFKEYQRNLMPVRKELFNEMQKLLIIYQNLCVYAANIDGIHSQANTLIAQYVSYINMRISLYRHGWLHNKSNQDQVPELLNCDDFNLKDTNRTIYIDVKIKEIIDVYDKIMKS